MMLGNQTHYLKTGLKKKKEESGTTFYFSYTHYTAGYPKVEENSSSLVITAGLHLINEERMMNQKSCQFTTTNEFRRTGTEYGWVLISPKKR